MFYYVSYCWGGQESETIPSWSIALMVPFVLSLTTTRTLSQGDLGNCGRLIGPRKKSTGSGPLIHRSHDLNPSTPWAV